MQSSTVLAVEARVDSLVTTKKRAGEFHVSNNAICMCSEKDFRGVLRCAFMPEKVVTQFPSVASDPSNCTTTPTNQDNFAFINSFAGYSVQGFCPGAPSKKHNQDSFIMMKDAASNSLLIACLDGHGQHGHIISQFFKQRIESRLFSHPLFLTEVQTAISAVLSAAELELQAAEPHVGEFSGTTLTLALIRGNQLLVANIGDSRTLLAQHHRRSAKHHHHRSGISGSVKRCERMSPDTVSNTPSPVVSRHKHRSLDALQLSTDHKPDNQEEYTRILAAGGRVFSVRYTDGVVGPARVWLQNSNVPGLAMSRSLGDFVVHSVGVSSAPEFVEVTLDAVSDCMLVLATDGLWDLVSNEEVVRIASACRDPGAAVLALLRESHQRWVQKEQMADDTTVCVVFLSAHHPCKSDEQS